LTLGHSAPTSSDGTLGQWQLGHLQRHCCDRGGAHWRARRQSSRTAENYNEGATLLIHFLDERGFPTRIDGIDLGRIEESSLGSRVGMSGSNTTDLSSAHADSIGRLYERIDEPC
jgi:hypothetical protein